MAYETAASLFVDGLYEAALSHFDAAVAQATENGALAMSRALRGKAVTLLRLGRSELALAEANLALSLSPQDVPALLTIG